MRRGEVTREQTPVPEHELEGSITSPPAYTGHWALDTTHKTEVASSNSPRLLLPGRYTAHSPTPSTYLRMCTRESTDTHKGRGVVSISTETHAHAHGLAHGAA